MQCLDLSPLPCTLLDDAQAPLAMAPGFVDEAVVISLLSGGSAFRQKKDHHSLALAADEMDYAGWPPETLPGASDTRRF